MKPFLIFPLLRLTGLGALAMGPGTQAQAISQAVDPSDSMIRDAFARQGIRFTGAEATRIRVAVVYFVTPVGKITEKNMQ